MKKLLALLLAILIYSLGNQHASAGNVINFRATINAGSLMAAVRNSKGIDLASPVVDFGRFRNSIDCQNSEKGIQGAMGSDDQRIYVDNPKAALNGWSLTITAAAGSSSLWSANDSTLDFNDSGNSGCTDSDGDGTGGLLAIDPSQAVIKTDCLECGSGSLFLGTPSNFSSTPNITLLSATNNADTLGSWYITGVRIKQSIPEGQTGASYSLPMTLTATAT